MQRSNANILKGQSLIKILTYFIKQTVTNTYSVVEMGTVTILLLLSILLIDPALKQYSYQQF